jgi:hypothetical protein
MVSIISVNITAPKILEDYVKRSYIFACFALFL